MKKKIVTIYAALLFLRGYTVEDSLRKRARLLKLERLSSMPSTQEARPIVKLLS